MIADTVIRASEANPKDIVLYVPPNGSLAFPPGIQETTIFLFATEAQAQSKADSTDIVVTRTFADIAPPAPAPVSESKMFRWTGTEWVTVGTIVVFQ
jgi:hypothetical protein